MSMCIEFEDSNVRIFFIVFGGLLFMKNFEADVGKGCTGSMQCNVSFGYQLSICSRNEENNGENHEEPCMSWPVAELKMIYWK